MGSTQPPTPLPSQPTNGAPPQAIAPRNIPVPQLIIAMLKSHSHVSDLIFSPGRAPQVEVNGQLVELPFKGVERLLPADTIQIARSIIGANDHAARKLETDGATDLSYSVDGASRFRVNIFRQRGSCAIVMRVVPNHIPSFEDLNLPPQIAEICTLRNGIVLVTGPTGSGKSSTLAAVIDKMNEQKAIHILTIEDPIEFLHRHKKATIHQRELHSDTPTFSSALRAALRQAPKVILVGEMRDRETIEIALEASETGHLVLSTLHTIDAAKAVERIIGAFPMEDQQGIRNRLSKAFRFILSQRLLPRLDGSGRIAVLEILKSSMRTREYIEKGESEGKSLLDAMRDGTNDGMQHFDAEIEKLVRSGVVDMETGVTYSTNAGNFRLELADFIDSRQKAKSRSSDAKEDEIEIIR
jgi:twitching motility protein PilT